MTTSGIIACRFVDSIAGGLGVVASRPHFASYLLLHRTGFRCRWNIDGSTWRRPTASLLDFVVVTRLARGVFAASGHLQNDKRALDLEEQVVEADQELSFAAKNGVRANLVLDYCENEDP